MALTNKSNLKSQAELIRNEDSEGKNTAERIGKVLVEIIENTDQSLTTETNERTSKDNTLQQAVTVASNTATTAYNEAKDAKSKATTAQSTADSAKSKAEAAQNDVNTINESKGKVNGFASLDEEGKVPTYELPDTKDVVEFDGIYRFLISPTFQNQSIVSGEECLFPHANDISVV